MRTRRESPLKVLMFHGVVRQMPEYAVYPGTRTCLIRERDFDSCIEWCTRTHKVITLGDLPRYLSGEATEPAVLITFDDGLASVIDLALPVLQKYRARAVMFVTTDWIDRQEAPAMCRLERDLWDAPPSELAVQVGGHNHTVPVRSRSGVRAALSSVWDFCLSRRIAPCRCEASRYVSTIEPGNPSPQGMSNTPGSPPGGKSWPAPLGRARSRLARMAGRTRRGPGCRTRSAEASSQRYGSACSVSRAVRSGRVRIRTACMMSRRGLPRARATSGLLPLRGGRWERTGRTPCRGFMCPESVPSSWTRSCAGRSQAVCCAKPRRWWAASDRADRCRRHQMGGAALLATRSSSHCPVLQAPLHGAGRIRR